MGDRGLRLVDALGYYVQSGVSRRPPLPAVPNSPGASGGRTRPKLVAFLEV